jgi:cell fate (sporulation/competence/biofilm development) regulator YlbF (YheA/YmcA/DUF963 family)
LLENRDVAGERLERLRELKAQFDEVHRQGMDALRAGDYSALDAAIRAEKAILDEQSALLKEQRAEIAEMLKKPF